MNAAYIYKKYFTIDFLNERMMIFYQKQETRFQSHLMQLIFHPAGVDYPFQVDLCTVAEKCHSIFIFNLPTSIFHFHFQSANFSLPISKSENQSRAHIATPPHKH